MQSGRCCLFPGVRMGCHRGFQAIRDPSAAKNMVPFSALSPRTAMCSQSLGCFSSGICSRLRLHLISCWSDRKLWGGKNLPFSEELIGEVIYPLIHPNLPETGARTVPGEDKSRSFSISLQVGQLQIASFK